MLFSCRGPTKTLGMAWSARNWLGGQGKRKRQKLPFMSKTRDFHITKRGNFGSKIQIQRGGASLRAKSESQWRGEKGGSFGTLISLTYHSFTTYISQNTPPLTFHFHFLSPSPFSLIPLIFHFGQAPFFTLPPWFLTFSTFLPPSPCATKVLLLSSPRKSASSIQIWLHDFVIFLF